VISEKTQLVTSSSLAEKLDFPKLRNHSLSSFLFFQVLVWLLWIESFSPNSVLAQSLFDSLSFSAIDLPRTVSF
jgi:hypothetical protein